MPLRTLSSADAPSNHEFRELYARCRAFLMPGEEDFRHYRGGSPGERETGDRVPVAEPLNPFPALWELSTAKRQTIPCATLSSNRIPSSTTLNRKISKAGRRGSPKLSSPRKCGLCFGLNVLVYGAKLLSRSWGAWRVVCLTGGNE